jgi:hypothetical protein
MALNVIFKIELVFKQFVDYIHDICYSDLIHAWYNLKIQKMQYYSSIFVIFWIS